MVNQEKNVIEEVSGWLRIFDDGSVDRTWSGPPNVVFMTKPVPAHEEFIDGVAVRDVIIDPNSGHSVRIYMPELKPDEDHSKLPILLHFHGGGFCISQADWYLYYHVYTRIARTARVICVSVRLRLAPEHRIPAACDDAYSGLIWLRALARAETSEAWLNAHADFGRVFMIGDSSGGNLVHQVAARAGDEEWAPLKLSGAIPIHPGFMRSERSKSELMKQYESPMLTLDMVDKFMALSLPIGSTKDHPITCPMGSAAPSLAELKLPPFLVMVAELDLIRDTELEYCEAMKKAGKDVEVFSNTGVGHSFYLNKLALDFDPQTASQFDLMITKIIDFIRQH